MLATCKNPRPPSRGVSKLTGAIDFDDSASLYIRRSRSHLIHMAMKQSCLTECANAFARPSILQPLARNTADYRLFRPADRINCGIRPDSRARTRARGEAGAPVFIRESQKLQDPHLAIATPPLRTRCWTSPEHLMRKDECWRLVKIRGHRAEE